MPRMLPQLSTAYQATGGNLPLSGHAHACAGLVSREGEAKRRGRRRADPMAQPRQGEGEAELPLRLKRGAGGSPSRVVPDRLPRQGGEVKSTRFSST
jgi:hypothetical protein